MTTEEKAKAYDEALERLKPLYEQAKKDDNPIWSTYEYLVPELKESDDEKTRKEIMNFILHKAGALIDEDTEHRYIAYLEKQKINTEGDFGRGYDCGYQAGYAIAMNEMKPKVATTTLDSEKQKEQEHICDSAQYEEGFKTGLEIGLRKQKECLADDSKTSIDDDERARKWLIDYFSPIKDMAWIHRDISPEQILTYLEKQKSKDDEEEYLDGIKRDWFERGKKEVLTVPELYGLEKQKEQKPVEINNPTDDELQRHQDELYDFKVFAAMQAKEHHISFVHDFEWNNFCAELLSYFNEKQKPVEIKIDNPNIQKIDPDVKISTSDSSAGGDGLIYTSWRDEKAGQNLNIKLLQKSWYMEGYHDREFNKEPKWIIKTGEGGPRYEENPKYGQHIEKQDYSGLTELEQAIHRGFLCAGVENVPVNIIKETAQDCLAHLPAEWSEDFDKEVENVHKRYPEVSYAKLTRIAYHFSKWANRHKDIEWSEEDEEHLDSIIESYKELLKDYSANHGVDYIPYNTPVVARTVLNDIDFLKSLRPSWKPSEEQEEPKYYQHFDPDC